MTLEDLKGLKSGDKVVWIDDLTVPIPPYPREVVTIKTIKVGVNDLKIGLVTIPIAIFVMETDTGKIIEGMQYSLDFL
jgi:hypothetical protein